MEKYGAHFESFRDASASMIVVKAYSEVSSLMDVGTSKNTSQLGISANVCCREVEYELSRAVLVFKTEDRGIVNRISSSSISAIATDMLGQHPVEKAQS